MILVNADKDIETQGNIQNGIEALQFNIKTLESLPTFFNKIVFKIKINKFKQNSPQIIIEDL